MCYISCCIHNIFCDRCCWFSQDSIVGRVSDLPRLASLGIESHWGGARFSAAVQMLQPSQPHVQWASGLFPRGWSMVLMLTTISAKVKERVELYLHSHPGPSWLGVGWTTPYHWSLLTANSALLWGWLLRQHWVKLNTSERVTNEMGPVKIRT